MGVKGLGSLVNRWCPNAIREVQLSEYADKKVAMDVDMCLHQCLTGDSFKEIDDDQRHLMGIFYISVSLMSSGVYPLYVFPGKAPEMKAYALDKKTQLEAKLREKLVEAERIECHKLVEKYKKRLLKVEPHHVEDTKKLLELMGLPHVQAPAEAEGQCAALVENGVVDAVASENSDSLAFGSGVILRHVTRRADSPIKEVVFEKVLEDLEMDHQSLVDLSILLGCDYCETIKDFGPKKALRLIKQHKTIESILDILSQDTKKWTIPENWRYMDARELFLNPQAAEVNPDDLIWAYPQVYDVLDYLVREKDLDQAVIRRGLSKLVTSY